jgi:two-component system nitrate/nitrite response regulator NarL
MSIAGLRPSSPSVEDGLGSRRIRILLADDHPLFLEGLARAVHERGDPLELMATARTGAEVLDALRHLRPEIAVLDVRMGDLGGAEIVSAVRREQLATRILLLSAYLEDDLVYETLADGASGYLSKEVDRDAILDAVVAVARGEVALSPGIQTALVREIRRRESLARHALSARELEILSLAARGSSTAEIATRLRLSTATVKAHLQRVYEKLGVADRTSAVVAALRRGLLD